MTTKKPADNTPTDAPAHHATANVPAFQAPKSTSFGAALALVQTLIALVFHLVGEKVQESVVIALAGIALASGWTILEAIAKHALKGRAGLVLALAGANVAGGMLGGGTGCAHMPAERGSAARFHIEHDATGPGCTVTLYVDGSARDVVDLADCAELLGSARQIGD